MKYHSIALLTLFFATQLIQAQEKPAKDWHLKSVADDKNTAGIGANQAYQLVADRESKPVVVAILDSGIDTTHEDLKTTLWVNKDEIPNNGIDDDNNGFIDDVHGWNFLGGDTATVNHETLEMVRIYRDLNAKRWNGENLTEEEEALLEKTRDEQQRLLKDAEADYAQAQNILDIYTNSNTIMALALDDGDYTLEQVLKYKPQTEREENARNFLLYINSINISPKDIKEWHTNAESKVKYNLNTEFDPRGIVGDDPNNWNDSIYGNQDIMGGDPSHGTHVAGIVGAIRNNDLGSDGIAPNVEIMVVRCVPDGDEYDKDVANAILYAVRNGAQVINMSFGKYYSPHSEWVAKATKVAEANGVIMVHAAGNDGKNLDGIAHFPVNKNGLESPFWIEIGAHKSTTKKKGYIAEFSNYGTQTVQLFAPGYDIYAPIPTTNEYDYNSGTSMAAPVVTGAVAFLLSYFPDAKPEHIKEVLLESANNYAKLKVMQPADGDYEDAKPSKVKFSALCTGGKSLNLEAATAQLLEERSGASASVSE